MRKPALIAFVLVLVAGLGAVLVAALSKQTRETQTVGVLPVLPVAPIDRGQEACQAPVALDEPLEQVRFNIGTHGMPGPPLAVTVRRHLSRSVLGAGRVQGGWRDDGTPREVAVGEVRGEQYVAVCIRNLGTVRGYVYGDVYSGEFGTGPTGVRPTTTTSSARIDGVPIPGDLSMTFTTREARSVLSLVPEIFARASLFRPALVGPWTFWLLLLAALVAAPVALWLALRAGAQPGDR